MKIDQRKLYVVKDVLQTLRRCRGYYNRPFGGPLVGYAGKYEVQATGEPVVKKHFVGYEYFNCAKAEQYPFVRLKWAEELTQQYATAYRTPDVILGAPMGGILFADSLAQEFRCRVIFAEKKIKTRSEVAGGRDETELVLDRHEIEPGDAVVIAEDVCNNFSTTAELAKLIVSRGAIPIAIACIVNRSASRFYASAMNGLALPVISLADLPAIQLKQEDPEVVLDIAKGNVVWKPKSRENWAGLMKLMEQGSA